MLDEQPQSEIQISAGEGMVAHLSGLMAYARGGGEELTKLGKRLELLAGSSWQQTVRSITTAISSVGFEHHPSIAFVLIEGRRVSAFAFGSVELTLVIDGGTTVLDGRDSGTWIDMVLHGSVDQVRAGATTVGPLLGILRNGVVPAGGFVFQAAQPAPPEQTLGATAGNGPSINDPIFASFEESVMSPDELDSSQPGMFALIAQRSPSEDSALLEKLSTDVDYFRDDLPDMLATSTKDPMSNFADEPSPFDQLEQQIEDDRGAATLTNDRPHLLGVLCPSGHFTSPELLNCLTCDIEVVAGAKTVSRPRPVLGYLTFDDGAVLAVDRPAVIGANVPNGYNVNDEPTTMVRLDDGHGGISDVQLEVRASGWNVEIVDMGSENGTYTVVSGERQTRSKLRTGFPVPLRDGTVVEMGTRTCTFSLKPSAKANGQ